MKRCRCRRRWKWKSFHLVDGRHGILWFLIASYCALYFNLSYLRGHKSLVQCTRLLFYKSFPHLQRVCSWRGIRVLRSKLCLDFISDMASNVGRKKNQAPSIEKKLDTRAKISLFSFSYPSDTYRFTHHSHVFRHWYCYAATHDLKLIDNLFNVVHAPIRTIRTVWYLPNTRKSRSNSPRINSDPISSRSFGRRFEKMQHAQHDRRDIVVRSVRTLLYLNAITHTRTHTIEC